MDLDKLNFVPEWQDEKFDHGDEGREWKTATERAAAKALYLKWREVFGLVIAFAENLPEDLANHDTHEKVIKKLIYKNAMIVAPKIISAAGTDIYILQMENAAIIRTSCRQLMEQVGFAALTGLADNDHKNVIEDAIHQFRDLFKNWIATFRRDGCGDEWGIFH